MSLEKIPKRSLFLASGSPRRKELLELLGYEFEIVKPDIIEQRESGESPEAYVQRLSRQKAEAGVSMTPTDSLIIGSDTIVVLGDKVLEKPKNQEHSMEMLRSLSGRQHSVMTAVTVADDSKHLTHLVITKVWFKELTTEEITRYWQSGEPCDKAGSYGIQGIGGRFVSKIEGSYHAVVGLPMMETDQLLHEFI